MEVIKNPSRSDWAEILARPMMETKELEALVIPVLEAVKSQGDTALKKFTQQFDGVSLENLQVSQAEFEDATNAISKELKSAIQQARENISKFHLAQREESQQIETMPGVNCWRKSVGIPRVGLYIPGGTAPLFSTILMLGVPAMIAGCEQIILCTPPSKEGKVHPAILYTANLLGIKEVFKAGGSQAIAAMAYGTESIPKVDKIFGPGNQYVTVAKQLVNKEGISIDMPAGPSEVLVVADHTASPDFVAADLLSQAEHGIDSQVILVTMNDQIAQNCVDAVEAQLASLPRKEIAAEALKHSKTIVVNNQQEALDLVNVYAPEHLILALENAEAFGDRVINAGSVFLGNYTPESVGDYASGTNHTLPTNGFARAYSGVSLDSFVKKITFQRLSPEGLQALGPAVEIMAAAEELEAHKRAVSIRLEELEKK